MVLPRQSPRRRHDSDVGPREGLPNPQFSKKTLWGLSMALLFLPQVSLPPDALSRGLPE